MASNIIVLHWRLAFVLVALMSSVHAGLVGYWKFDESSGAVVEDSSGLGNHGVLVNANAETRASGRPGMGGALYLGGVTGAGTVYVTIPDALTSSNPPRSKLPAARRRLRTGVRPSSFRWITFEPRWSSWTPMRWRGLAPGITV